MNRRSFLKASLAATLSQVWAQDAPKPTKMRLACCAANFHGFSGGADPLPAIQTIGELGFDGIELILLAPADLSTVWTGDSLDKIEAALSLAKLTVSRFGVFGPCQRNIASYDNAKRDADFDTFEKACAVAKRLKAEQIGYVGWSVPGTSSFSYQLANDAPPGAKLTQPLAATFDWDKFWVRSVDSNKELLARAKAHGLTICIEPHFHGIPQTAEQFLLLYKEINDTALGYLLDSCWLSVQAAYPPLMAKMMARHITNVQFRDTDATTRNNRVSFGNGVVDFTALVSALKSIHYTGFVALEEVFMPAKVMVEDAKNFMAFMRAELSKP